jgi:hypothetical protein
MTPTYMMQCAFGLVPYVTFVWISALLVMHRRKIEVLEEQVRMLKEERTFPVVKPEEWMYIPDSTAVRMEDLV